MLLHYSDADLPVYPLEVVLSPADMEARVGQLQSISFVRVVRTSGPDETLRQRLDRADEFFCRISNLCQIETIPYRWGLCPANEDIHLLPPPGDCALELDSNVQYMDPANNVDARYWDPILPKGFLLAAEVANITPHENGDMPRDAIDPFLEGEEAFLEEMRTLDASRAYMDFGPHQTIYGSQNWDPKAPSNAVWYADIEPLVGQSVNQLVRIGAR